MFKSAIPILLVILVVVGLLAWANPVYHQQMLHFAAQAGSSVNAVISASAKGLSTIGVQINAYIRAHWQSNSSAKPAPAPTFNVQAFFNTLVQQITRLLAQAAAWFNATFQVQASSPAK